MEVFYTTCVLSEFALSKIKVNWEEEEQEFVLSLLKHELNIKK